MNNTEYAKVLATHMFNTVFDGISRTMKLNRQSYSGVIDKISPEVCMGAYDISVFLNFEEYNDIVIEFKSILDTKLSHCKNNAFYQNIQDLDLKEFDNPAQAKVKEKGAQNTTGSYNIPNNLLRIYKDNILKKYRKSFEEVKRLVTMHELLHMASSYKKGTIKICGFHQKVGIFGTGRGLNEGYTELLTYRYFHDNKNKYPNKSYREERLLALGIEELVGREEMEKLYFAGDLKGLVDRLNQWATIDEIKSIIKNIDDCRWSIKNSKDLYEYERIAGETRVSIANIRLRKCNELLRTGKMTQEEYDDERLKIEFFVKGSFLEKKDDNFVYRDIFYDETVITKECYRLTKQHFLETSKDNLEYSPDDHSPRIYDIIHYAEEIQNRSDRENLDLSNIERVETEKNGFGVRYTFISKEDNKVTTESSKTELAEMLNGEEIQQKNQTNEVSKSA